MNQETQTPGGGRRYARVLTIAGSDSGGGAGLQAGDARVRGVRNVDCGADVAGHTAWRFGVGRALREAGWSDLVDSEVERQMLQGRRQGQEEEEGREKAVERGGAEDEDAQELSDEKIRAQLEKGE